MPVNQPNQKQAEKEIYVCPFPILRPISRRSYSHFSPDMSILIIIIPSHRLFFPSSPASFPDTRDTISLTPISDLHGGNFSIFVDTPESFGVEPFGQIFDDDRIVHEDLLVESGGENVVVAWRGWWLVGKECGEYERR